MVIECPACKTKFKLPDEKIGPSGVSVRCSKCTTTFAVRPPAAAAPSAPEADPTIVSARRPPEPPPQPRPPSGVPDLFGNDDFATQTALSTPQQPPSSTPTTPQGFGGMTDAFTAGVAASGGGAPPIPPAMPPPAGFGTPFVNMDVTQAGGPPPSAPVVQDDPSTLHAEDGVSDVQPGLDESVRATLLGTNAPGTSLSEEGDQGLPPDEARTGGAANFDFGSDPFSGGAPANGGGPRPAAPPSELFAARPKTVQAPPPPVESVGLAEPTKAGKTGTAKKKKAVPRMATAFIDAPREPARAYRVLLALFFAGAFASAFASLTDGSFDFGRIDRGRLSLLIGPPVAPEGIDGLAITARRGGYVTTSPGKPRVYAAHGVAINAGGAPKGFLEVRGRMLDAGGAVLAEATVPCGNAFRDDQLLGFRSGDELRRAYLPAGDGLSNQKLAPGAAVACTVVFFEAPSPEKTAAFDLEIVAAQPAS